MCATKVVVRKQIRKRNKKCTHISVINCFEEVSSVDGGWSVDEEGTVSESGGEGAVSDPE